MDWSVRKAEDEEDSLENSCLKGSTILHNINQRTNSNIIERRERDVVCVLLVGWSWCVCGSNWMRKSEKLNQIHARNTILPILDERTRSRQQQCLEDEDDSRRNHLILFLFFILCTFSLVLVVVESSSSFFSVLVYFCHNHLFLLRPISSLPSYKLTQ